MQTRPADPCAHSLSAYSVVVHPKSAGVIIRDSKFDVVQELRDSKQIKIIQDAFLRAKRVGDTATKLKSTTHKIDFSDRWLIDIHSGEFRVLTKVVTDVYQLDANDLVAVKSLLEPRAEQAVPSDGHKPSSSVPTAGSTAPADAH